jgi:hypothetical protein
LRVFLFDVSDATEARPRHAHAGGTRFDSLLTTYELTPPQLGDWKEFVGLLDGSPLGTAHRWAVDVERHSRAYKRGFPKRLPEIRYAAVHYFAANAATLR